MNENKITYDDIKNYENLFTRIPAFLLERYAKKNTNLVSKFKSVAQNYMGNLTQDQKNKLDIVLNSDIDELQAIMDEAYNKTDKKQFKILSNPKYKPFIENNLNEIKKMI